MAKKKLSKIKARIKCEHCGKEQKISIEIPFTIEELDKAIRAAKGGFIGNAIARASQT